MTRSTLDALHNLGHGAVVASSPGGHVRCRRGAAEKILSLDVEPQTKDQGGWYPGGSLAVINRGQSDPPWSRSSRSSSCCSQPVLRRLTASLGDQARAQNLGFAGATGAVPTRKVHRNAGIAENIEDRAALRDFIGLPG